MARPTPEEIAAWEARMNEPEGNDDNEFEVEIYSPEGHGARVPYSKARGYLQKNFGIDLDEIPKPGAPGTPPANSTDPNAQLQDPPGNVGPARPTAKYFGKGGK